MKTICFINSNGLKSKFFILSLGGVRGGFSYFSRQPLFHGLNLWMNYHYGTIRNV
jgi:hypothetical protein